MNHKIDILEFKCPSCGCVVKVLKGTVIDVSQSSVFALLNKDGTYSYPQQCPNCPQTTIFTVKCTGDGTIISYE